MEETTLHLYQSKVKIILYTIIFFPFMAGGYYFTYIAVKEQSFLGMLTALFIAILFTVLSVAFIFKLMRNQPNFTITNTYIKLNPQTKNEITIYYDQIRTIEVSESFFQKSIELVIYDEDEFNNQLSLYNKIKLAPNNWFGYKTITTSHKAVAKRDRLKLLTALDNIVEGRTMGHPSVIDIHHQSIDSQKDFMEKYDLNPITDLKIDNTYFKKAFGYSLFIFLFMFVLFYLLIDSGDGYLSYITISFFAFPFAKVLIDWMGIHKLRQKLDKQKGVTFYLYQLIFVFDALLFHISIFIAPFGLLFLFIRYIIKKKNVKKK
ncbi:STM3941 family protein [Virgibacillus sp. W0181]|uniref:STM3941 family protein n=1 Tax=Virgibacillus sp. W0181 TaxID=3391581 RepID=UPI003F450F6F